jgi:hypothetical protein
MTLSLGWLSARLDGVQRLSCESDISLYEGLTARMPVAVWGGVLADFGISGVTKMKTRRALSIHLSVRSHVPGQFGGASRAMKRRPFSAKYQRYSNLTDLTDCTSGTRFRQSATLKFILNVPLFARLPKPRRRWKKPLDRCRLLRTVPSAATSQSRGCEPILDRADRRDVAKQIRSNAAGQQTVAAVVGVANGDGRPFPSMHRASWGDWR